MDNLDYYYYYFWIYREGGFNPSFSYEEIKVLPTDLKDLNNLDLKSRLWFYRQSLDLKFKQNSF